MLSFLCIYLLYLCRLIDAWIVREVGADDSGMTSDVVHLLGGCMNEQASETTSACFCRGRTTERVQTSILHVTIPSSLQSISTGASSPAASETALRAPCEGDPLPRHPDSVGSLFWTSNVSFETRDPLKISPVVRPPSCLLAHSTCILLFLFVFIVRR